MRFNAIAGRVRHQAGQMLRTARHVGYQLDRGIHSAAHLYRHVQPALRAAGIDTSEVDMKLKGGYDLYSQYSSMLNDGVEVVDGIAKNLRGGSFKYQ